ncbi:hypothetical protein OAA41_00080 [bacterium]|nr:hypothetical protein [bacterium]
MKDVDRGNLPLPPLVLTRDKRYLLDPKSPLTRKDFENLFKSNVTSKVVKRLAKKVGLIETDKTIAELKRAIGRKLASMNVREPILLPGSRVYTKPKSEDFVNEMSPIRNDENREENQNRNQNREENQNRNQNREEKQNRNQNRNQNREEIRNRGVIMNSSSRSLRNTLARKRHMDRVRQLRGGSVLNVPNDSIRRNMNAKMQIEKAKLNAERRLLEQKRNFNKRFSEKQVIEERRKRREARIIETQVQNGRRAQINANIRTKKAEAARNREYENKKRAQLKANTNSQRVKRMEKNYQNLRNKTKRTLNRYNLNRKRAFTQLSESQSKMRSLSDKLRKEIDRANLERDTSKKLQSDLNVAEMKVEKSEQRIKKIEKERNALNVTILDLQSRLETKTKNGNEADVDRLTKELDEAKTKIEELTNEVTTLTNNTKQVVADATKELNEKLAQAVIASNANKKKVALSEAKYKAARSEMNSKNAALKKAMNNKQKAINGLRADRNRKLLNKNAALKKAQENKNAEVASARMAAITDTKASMQNELNKIKIEKEKALEKAANERRNAVAAAEKATREKALAETATEKAAAEQKLKNAQAKINAAAADREQALMNAKAERNAALKKAMNNKQKAINGLRADRNRKLLNKNAAAEQKLKNAQVKINAATADREQALMNAKAERNAALKKAMNNKQKAINGLRADRNRKLLNKNAATQNAQSKLNTIRKEKENALALANAERKKAVLLAEEAARAKAAAKKALMNKEKARLERIEKQKREGRQIAADRALAQFKANAKRSKNDMTNKKAINAMKAVSNKEKANKAAANKAATEKAAANKAAAEKAAAEKAAAEKAAAEKAAANKAAKAKEMIETALRAKAQKAREAVQKAKNEKLASNRRLIQDKMATIAKMRKILATYKGTNPFRRSTVESQGKILIQKFQKGELKQIEPAIIKLVSDMKKKNADGAAAKLVNSQTARAAEQFDMRKKKEAENKEKARLARIEIQKREGKQVAAERALAQFKANAKRSKNAMANKKAIDAMKEASNKKVVSNLVSGALTKAIKSGPVTTIYQSSTDANRNRVKSKVDEKVETKGYKAVWGTMIDTGGKDKASLNKIETKLNKKYVLKQGIQQLPGVAFRKGRVPGSGVATKTSLLTQVMRPYIGGDDKYDEHKKQYNDAFKVYKNPAFGNTNGSKVFKNPMFGKTNSSKVNGMVTANNVLISMKRAPVPPVGNKRPNGRALQRFRAAAQTQIPPAKPSAIATAVKITMNKKKAVGNPALARQAYTNQGKFQRNMNIRKAAEGARNAAKGKLAREADKKKGWNLNTLKGRAKTRVGMALPGAKMLKLRKKYHSQINSDVRSLNAIMTDVDKTPGAIIQPKLK